MPKTIADKLCIYALTALTLGACGHVTMRGSVAMKVDDRLAHVCLGNNEVKPGDRVALFQNECVTSRADPEGKIQAYAKGCRKVEIGGGEVVDVLNEHYSVIRVDAGVPFQEGTVVEKKR